MGSIETSREIFSALECSWVNVSLLVSAHSWLRSGSTTQQLPSTHPHKKSHSMCQNAVSVNTYWYECRRECDYESLPNEAAIGAEWVEIDLFRFIVSSTSIDYSQQKTIWPVVLLSCFSQHSACMRWPLTTNGATIYDNYAKQSTIFLFTSQLTKIKIIEWAHTHTYTRIHVRSRLCDNLFTVLLVCCAMNDGSSRG